MAIIAPSVLAADLGRIDSEIESVTHSGADWLHIDVMDGSFVPPITFGANIVRTIKKTCALPLDVHLMIREPEKHIAAFADAGASGITVHIEACPHLHRVLQSIRERGLKAGVAINPGTDIHALEASVPVADLILVMSVNPGWGGQQFIAESLDRIRTVRQFIAKHQTNTLIEVDGGINETTAAACLHAGVDVLVAGTSIFGAADYKKAISALRPKSP